MTNYLYYPPYSVQGMGHVSPAQGKSIELGKRQMELLSIARASKTHTLVLTHGRNQMANAQRMAARRLVARGLLQAPNAMGNAATGWLYFYALTEKGLSSWLRIAVPAVSAKK